MKRLPSAIWAAVILGASYLWFQYAVAPLTGLVTGIPAPLPSSLVLLYVGMIALAILIYVSVQEERWKNFREPILAFLRESKPSSLPQQVARTAFLVLLPVIIGWQVYSRASAPPEAPKDPPGIHFSLPVAYTTMVNPLPWTPENIREGGILYTKNCAMCHGDALDGNGLFARAFQPRPANFRDSGTIAQLDENYLYWRIKEGGPGLPQGSIGYRSAMPAWDGVLKEDEIWKIIMFEYTSAGVKPAKR